MHRTSCYVPSVMYTYAAINSTVQNPIRDNSRAFLDPSCVVRARGEDFLRDAIIQLYYVYTQRRHHNNSYEYDTIRPVAVVQVARVVTVALYTRVRVMVK